jgi:hypothetical protein
MYIAKFTSVESLCRLIFMILFCIIINKICSILKKNRIFMLLLWEIIDNRYYLVITGL